MLNKQNRLTKRKEFAFLYKNGKRVYGTSLNLVYFTTKLNHARFGFVVSKKVGKAYVRNKIKRQLREIVRANIDKFSTKCNYIYVAKPEIVGKEYKQIETEVLTLLNKIPSTQKEVLK